MTDPTQLSRYKIESHLGTGAFADVYKAVDTVLDRTVALKVLKPMLVADREAFARFTREARTLANLTHPHIAWVWDLGEAEGRYFIAMRYVDGKSLDKVIVERGVLGWNEALKITEEIGSALQFAHAKGLVHRDVKPQNILISASEGAVLTDFGLAKALNASGMTTSSNFLGTPNYMAPELWGDEEASPASDQYALTCVLDEMLTGKQLYSGKTPLAVMAKHSQPPELPASWPASVPSGFSGVMLKSLSQKPQDRFANMQTFLSALHAPKPEAIPLIISQQSSIANQKSKIENPQFDNPARIEWVEVPAGEFLFGNDKEKQYIRKPFWIGKYPVTNAQYKLFLDANPAQPVPQDWEAKKRIYPPGKEKHPVVYVSWYDAQAFCVWAGCRLPTESEWEKAARGTDGRKYPWGEDWVAGKYCNSVEARLGGTTPVDEFPEGVSPYGAWDMSGNVFEWGVSVHEKGGYVLRGGSWCSDVYYLRSAARGRYDPTYGNYYIGFRCGHSLPWF